MREPRVALACLLSVAALVGACAPAPATRAADRPLMGAALPGGDPSADLLDQDTLTLRAPSIEQRTFLSAALGRAMPYVTYLPPGYDDTTDRYPVLYMLHGMGGNYEEWRRLGLLDTADRLIRTGQLAPLIIVLPQGDQGYWVDHANGGERWGTYTARDLVAEVDARYRTVARRAARAIGGLSMGAHGALQLALNNPGTFAAVGAHSLVLRRFGSAPRYFGDPADYAKRDPMTIVRTKPDLARSLSLWIDIGDRDPWSPIARQFNAQLEELRIAHDWRLVPGDHSNDYWRSNLSDYLRFYGRALGMSRPLTGATAPLTGTALGAP